MMHEAGIAGEGVFEIGIKFERIVSQNIGLHERGYTRSTIKEINKDRHSRVRFMLFVSLPSSPTHTPATTTQLHTRTTRPRKS